MDITVKIDWLRCSVPSDHQQEASLLSSFDCTITHETCRPFPWYTHAYKLSGGGRVDWAPDRPSQGVLYTFTGQDLEAQALRGFFPTALVHHFLAVPRSNFTRLDLALDVKRRDAYPMALLDAFRMGLVHTHVQRATAIRGYNKERKANGETIYFGSRTGERMLRVYDKAAEQGWTEPCTRLELELKQDQARRAALALETQSVGVVTAGMITEYLPFPVDWFQDAMLDCRAYDLDSETVGRHKGKDSTWLYEVAGKNFLTAIQQGDAQAWDMLVDTMTSDELYCFMMLKHRILKDDSDTLHT